VPERLVFEIGRKTATKKGGPDPDRRGSIPILR
jgi:hypothetical protein